MLYNERMKPPIQPNADEVIAFLCPDASSKGQWVCSGRRDDDSIYSQTISWDGVRLSVSIENMEKGIPWRLHILAHAGDGVRATVNGEEVDVTQALILFGQESQNMPIPSLLPHRPAKVR